MFELDGVAHPPGPIPEWTYQSQLRVIGSVRVSSTELLASTRLPDLGNVRAVMQVECLATGYRAVTVLEADACTDVARPLVIDVPPGETARDVETKYCLVWTGDDHAPSDDMVVHLRGGRLQTDTQTHRAQLEGDGSGFPSEAFPFSESGLYPEGTPWLLNFRPELDLPFLANARVFINTDHERQSDLLTSKDTLAKQVLFHDVLQQMLDAVAFTVAPADIVPTAFDEGSTGAVLNDLSVNFLGVDLAQAVVQLRDERSRTLARLKAATGLLTGGVR